MEEEKERGEIHWKTQGEYKEKGKDDKKKELGREKR